ncbi:hypothetical protein E2C01_019326 [Portunus trituberculatus]|uniref:Uncharacterized protein n=1 Tax=Portunus trituberculatus TaxID=210409 RepID=A0A5B7DWX2_PORTR|nr:hypothetical protein [Portunus trituberculatus]
MNSDEVRSCTSGISGGHESLPWSTSFSVNLSGAGYSLAKILPIYFSSTTTPGPTLRSDVRLNPLPILAILTAQPLSGMHPTPHPISISPRLPPVFRRLPTTTHNDVQNPVSSFLPSIHAVPSDSDFEYLPGNDANDDSSESDCKYESEDDFIYKIDPMMDHGWRLMSDRFSDEQPDPVPIFSANADGLDPANLSAMSVSTFMCPSEAFMYVFDNEVLSGALAIQRLVFISMQNLFQNQFHGEPVEQIPVSEISAE